MYRNVMEKSPFFFLSREPQCLFKNKLMNLNRSMLLDLDTWYRDPWQLAHTVTRSSPHRV